MHQKTINNNQIDNKKQHSKPIYCCCLVEGWLSGCWVISEWSLSDPWVILERSRRARWGLAGGSRRCYWLMRIRARYQLYIISNGCNMTPIYHYKTKQIHLIVYCQNNHLEQQYAKIRWTLRCNTTSNIEQKPHLFFVFGNFFFVFRCLYPLDVLGMRKNLTKT